MKVLLVGVNAKYIHSNPAIYGLKAYAKEYGKEVEIAEYTINHRLEAILSDLYERQADVIAISCYIWNINMVYDILTELPKILPEAQLWLGGPEVSFHSQEILKKYPQLKGIMIGEGEATFLELLHYYKEQDRTLESIKGLMLAGGYTGDRDLTPLEELPFLYENLDGFQNRIIYYESSRGCPFRCSYCLSSIDKKVRLRPLNLVKKELQFFIDRNVPQVKFIDRTFNCNHEHAKGIWEYILEHDNGVTNFHFEIAADLLTDDEIVLLSRMRPGLVQLEIGVQSTNPETLQAINRVTDMSHLKDVVDRIRAAGNIHQHLDLIAGLPYEDYESFAKSFDDVYAMRPQQLQLGFLKVLKGSPMEEQADAYGVQYLSKSPYEVISSNWLPYKDVLRLKRIEEMVEIYYNSNQFMHILEVMLPVFQSPFSLFEKLAEFYEENHYFVESPARSYRYQVLLNFMEKYDASGMDFYREIMTFDLYLRENLKSRPDFAIDLKEYKTEIKEFYRKEEKEPEILVAYRDFHSAQTIKMTHMEPFHYNVFAQTVDEMQKRLDEPMYLLFDYQKRNPLTYEAGVIQVDLNKE